MSPIGAIMSRCCSSSSNCPPPLPDQDRHLAHAGASAEATLDSGVDGRLEPLMFAPRLRRCRCRWGWVADRRMCLLLLRQHRLGAPGGALDPALLLLHGGRHGHRHRAVLPTAAAHGHGVVGLVAFGPGAAAAGGVARRRGLPLAAFDVALPAALDAALRGALQPRPRVSGRRILHGGGIGRGGGSR